ncbi:MAG: PilW family protein [Nitrospinota bacterium]
MYRSSNNIIRVGSGGFTLLELLVTIVIGAIILGGVAAVFTSNRDAQTLFKRMQETEENNRIAINFMSRDIRMSETAPILALDNLRAGGAYSSAVSSLSAKDGTDIVRLFVPQLAEGQSIIQPGSRSSSSCESEYAHNATALVGYVNLPAAKFQGVQNLSSANLDLLTDSQVHFYICENPTLNCILNISEVSLAGTGNCLVRIGVDRTATADVANQNIDCSQLNTEFDAGAAVCASVGKSYYYYIREGEKGLTDAYSSQLVRASGGNVEVIANNLADMQFSYGIDNDGDDRVDIWSNVHADASDSDLEGGSVDIQMINVQLLLESKAGARAGDVAKVSPVLANSSADLGSPAETKGKYYRTISRSVKIRNPN